MIDKQYGMFTIVCDICGCESEDFDTFQDAVDAKKRLGVKSQRQDGKWEDVCPECQGGRPLWLSAQKEPGRRPTKT